jgi:hypothetical protein
MKKLNLLLSLFLLTTTMLLAQNYKRKTPEEKAKKYTDELLAQIPLEKEQEEKVFKVNIIVSKQFDSLYAAKPEQNEMRKAYAFIFKQRDAEFKKIMTKEQFLRYDDWQRELREKRAEAKRLKEESEKQNQTPIPSEK